MICLQELEDARKEVEKTTGRTVVAKQSMFKRGSSRCLSIAVGVVFC